MYEFLQKVGVVVTALPGILAAVTAVLTVVAAEAIPLIPGHWGVRAAAFAATALAVLRVAAEVVARVTPVAPAERGVLPK